MATYRIRRRSKYYPERPFEVAGEIDAASESDAMIVMMRRLRDRAGDFDYKIEAVDRLTRRDEIALMDADHPLSALRAKD